MSTVPTTNPNPCPSPKKNELEKVFNRFDANGDGKISSSELSGVMTALGSTTSDEEIRRVMEEVDTDRDGFVSLAEFTAFYGGGGAAGDLKDAFDMYDGDNNGLISAPELLLVLTRLGEKFSVDDCSKMIKTFDSDGDGSVSFEEFKKMMTATPSPSSSK